jgi:membrane protein required for colicin V production
MPDWTTCAKLVAPRAGWLLGGAVRRIRVGRALNWLRPNLDGPCWRSIINKTKHERSTCLNWIDLVIILILAWFTYAAFHAGMIRELITIAGAVFGVALAGLFYKELAEDVKVAFDDQQTAEIIAFAMVFGATVLASQLLAIFLKQAASLLMLGLMDSLGGAIVGFTKGFIFVEIGLILAITFTTLGLEGAVQSSAIAPFFLDIVPALKLILPGEFKNAVNGF